MLNDADAAGIAEISYGWPDDQEGVVVLLTFGTGIGSALFLDGKLVPNTEFGHLEVDGHDAETRAAASVKEENDLSWADWAKRVARYVRSLEDLIWPDLIIAGGGVSKKADKWLPLLDVRTKVVAAELRNDAGHRGGRAGRQGRAPRLTCRSAQSRRIGITGRRVATRDTVIVVTMEQCPRPTVAGLSPNSGRSGIPDV